ncbi:Pycsar system effector family protein [Methyloradius palustris]|uniref:Pycsar effector protein domain-containing protein n=1 Tax=Methyloradius palustris TaxID=2778876 RepID=A0A8D5FXK3_9PROT|nr:Pycsar system effector family protein [Methyloradius palustris]BCM23852.1 hypothetical protein ZMTM_01110 [Methyloradius palustris]
MSSSTSIYLLRTMQQHHVALSRMADQKANIVIAGSVAVLLFSMGRIDAGEYSAWIFALATTALASATLAIIAVKPSISLIKKPVQQTNPLFFGHFAQMPEDEYVAEIMGLLEKDESIYKAMIQDTYQLGHTLYYKKYNYIGYSYNVFLFGITLTAGLALLRFL